MERGVAGGGVWHSPIARSIEAPEEEGQAWAGELRNP
jgi:hypothetical protein